MNIFAEKSYRKIFTTLVLERKQLSSSVNFQEISRYARIPKSYLSRVIHGKADLNQDQMSLACEFLGLSEAETDYMLLLLDYERSSLKKRKLRLEQKISRIQAENMEIKHHIEAAPTLPSNSDLAE